LSVLRVSRWLGRVSRVPIVEQGVQTPAGRLPHAARFLALIAVIPNGLPRPIAVFLLHEAVAGL
jgi:hypothetical protein